jgi:predicted dinucleotide-binding enzyme
MNLIGIIGSGIVAKTLASGLSKHGYQITMGTRNPEVLINWINTENLSIQVTTVEETAKKHNILILAVKGTAALQALESAGSENLHGKTIIDTTNPIADSPPDEGVLSYFTSLDHSLMEQLQNAYPLANFVKAYNSVGNAFMIDPQFKSGKPTMFICGNNSASKEFVSDMLIKTGWDVADMGGVKSARAIEPLCILWCLPGFNNNEWMHAFALLKQ